MQLHPTNAMAQDGEFPVILSGDALAIIELGAYRLFVESPADADRLIKAAIVAKRLLTGENPYPPATGRGCDVKAPDIFFRCTLNPGHNGSHEAHGAFPLPIWNDGDTEAALDSVHNCHEAGCLDNAADGQS